MVSTVVSEPSWNLHEAPGTVHASGNMRGCWGRLLQYESAIALYALLAVRAIVLLWLNDVECESASILISTLTASGALAAFVGFLASSSLWLASAQQEASKSGRK